MNISITTLGRDAVKLKNIETMPSTDPEEQKQEAENPLNTSILSIGHLVTIILDSKDWGINQNIIVERNTSSVNRTEYPKVYDILSWKLVDLDTMRKNPVMHAFIATVKETNLQAVAIPTWSWEEYSIWSLTQKQITWEHVALFTLASKDALVELLNKELS